MKIKLISNVSSRSLLVLLKNCLSLPQPYILTFCFPPYIILTENRGLFSHNLLPNYLPGQKMSLFSQFNVFCEHPTFQHKFFLLTSAGS